MAGVMHSIKEKLFSGEKHVDAEYDGAFTRFTQLHDSLVKLKATSQNFSNSIYSSLFNSNSAAVEFANILEDPLTENGYEVISKQMQTAHLQLNSDRQSALTARMSEGVLIPLDRLILHLLELNTKITRRNELHTNLEYYLGKTSTLVKEREERGGKGKVETASQKDKFDRNNHKLDTVRSEYSVYTAPLIVELQAAWQTRAVSLGPILAAFASVEKEFVQIYGAAVEQVHPEQIGTAPVTAASIGLARRQSNTPPISSVTTTTISPAAASVISAPITTNTITSAQPIASNVAPNPLVTVAEPASTHVRQTSVESGNSNPFGEINEPTSTTNASSTSTQSAILAVPITSTTTTTAAAPIVANPFEQSTIPAGSGAQFGSLGGIEGSSALPVQTLSSASISTLDPVQSSALAKSEHEDESKRQRYENDHKTANIIGV